MESFSDELPEALTLDNLKEMSIDLIDITTSTLTPSNITTTLKSGSSFSSRSSHTSIDESIDIVNNNNENLNEENEEQSDDVSNNTEEDLYEDISEDDNKEEEEEDEIHATIQNFPVHVICMEKCENTLDNLILNNKFKNEDEWFSALMQIIMILITYQKIFSFTHNDLHTNNIMYCETKLIYIYYCYKNKYYKVPTYGKIFKIIDFGRSIYKFQNKLFCSDSFENKGDASSQYNTEPFFNENKPRLEPNYSFDLCRLACSIFDYLVEDLTDVKYLKKCSPLIQLIVEWCLDDNGLNLLYKNDGTERYPDFKLYKMISRCVHNHTPQVQLDRKEFMKFIVNKKEINSNDLINIDLMNSQI